MDTRHGQDLEVRHDPDVVVTTTTPQTSTVPDGPPPAQPRGRLPLARERELALTRPAASWVAMSKRQERRTGRATLRRA